MPAAKKATPAKKAAAKKSAPAKKAAPAKVAAPKVSPDELAKKREAKAKEDAALTKKIVALRKQEKTWSEITEELGVSQGKASLLLMRHEAGDVGNATPAKVKADRDKSAMSWPAIAAKYGITKAKVQSLYREAGGDPHASYIGKGGRYFGHEDKVAKVKGTTSKAAPAKAAAKKSSAKTSTAKPLFDDNTPAADIIDKVTGKTVHYHSPDPDKYPGDNEVKVVSNIKVGKTAKGRRVIQFNDGDKSRTVAVDAVFKITK